MTLQQLNYVVKIAETKSMNKAAKELYVTQSALSSTIKSLEEELGIDLFIRSNRGIALTPDGEKFLSYARQISELSDMIYERFVSRPDNKKYFSVSMQHYSFAVEAFIRLTQEIDIREYDLAVHETKTGEVIDNVRNLKSELGILYLDQFNRKPLLKTFDESELEFIPLFDCSVSVFISKSHPLAGRDKITFDDLNDYPCLSFEQGENNAFYYAEEVLSTMQYTHVIKADDRATMLDMMTGLNGYTFCSGIISDETTDGQFIAVPFDTDDIMTIGYIKKKSLPLSSLALKYVRILETYQSKAV